MLLGSWMAIAVAQADAPPDWSELAPWRTHVVVEHIEPELQWFVVDAVPGLGIRCEARARQGVPEPAVTCGGEPSVGAGRPRAVPKHLRKLDKAVRAGIAEATGLSLRDLAGVDVRYLGRLQRVSFRQVVIVDAHDDPKTARTRTVQASWDVDLDTGFVDHGVGMDVVRGMPLCLPGVHVGCDAGPRLVPWTPPAAWEGMLVRTSDPTLPPDVLDGLEAAIRTVAMSEAEGGWTAPAPRAHDPALLPPDHRAGLAVRMHVRGQTGDVNGGIVTVGVPLNDVAFRPVAVRLPLTGTDVTLEVALDLPAETMAVRVRPAGGRYVEHTADVRCRFVVDAERAALPEPCPVDWGGRWLSWTSEDGQHAVWVQVEDLLAPLSTPQPSAGLLAADPGR